MNLKNFIIIFIYNLTLLHYSIMWYIIIIILILVCWSLYKVVREYTWNNYNKTEGFIGKKIGNLLIILRAFFFFDIFLLEDYLSIGLRNDELLVIFAIGLIVLSTCLEFIVAYRESSDVNLIKESDFFIKFKAFIKSLKKVKRKTKVTKW